MLEVNMKINEKILDYFNYLYSLIPECNFNSEYEMLKIHNIIMQMNIDIVKIMQFKKYNLDDIKECFEK